MWFAPLALAIALATPADGTVVLNSLFSDGMILQTNTQYGARAFLYGTAAPGEAIVVSGHKDALHAVADAQTGAWRVQMFPQAHSASAVFNLTVAGATNEVAISNVRFGDVYLCSGQSNMALEMTCVRLGNDAGERFRCHHGIRLCDTHPSLRL